MEKIPARQQFLQCTFLDLALTECTELFCPDDRFIVGPGEKLNPEEVPLNGNLHIRHLQL